VALGDVGGVGGDLVGDDTVLDVLALGEAEVLLRRDVAEHRRPEPADHGGADGGRDVVVAGGHVGRERTEGVERGLVADLELTVHVLLDEVHRDVAGALDHDLDVVLPGHLGQLAEGVELGELRFVVGVGVGAATETITEGEGDVVGAMISQISRKACSG
jgi:hypothetical protein